MITNNCRTRIQLYRTHACKASSAFQLFFLGLCLTTLWRMKDNGSLRGCQESCAYPERGDGFRVFPVSDLPGGQRGWTPLLLFLAPPLLLASDRPPGVGLTP